MTDTLTIYVCGSGHQLEHAEALSAGLRRHGRSSAIQHRGTHPSGTQVACWGWRVGQGLRAQGLDVLVMERGYIGDRFAYTSLAWNGLNGCAEPQQPGDGDRFARFEHLMQPWNPAGDYALVIGQVRGDMSLQGRDLSGWYAEQARMYSCPVLFRPHPETIRRNHPWGCPAGAKMTRRDLADDLRGARFVSTWNSNTGVDAILAGKPTFVADRGSMAWDVRVQDDYTAEPDRLTWARALAWRQWSLDEIRSGEAWAHVGR